MFRSLNKSSLDFNIQITRGCLCRISHEYINYQLIFLNLRNNILTSLGMASSPRVLRPRPRRAFDLPSADSSQPGTPTLETAPTATASSTDYVDAKSSSASKTGQSLGQDLSQPQDDLTSSRSMMNLTSPTLYGIYSPTAFDGVRDDSGTPWDTGAQTPNPHGRDYFSPHGSRQNGNNGDSASNGSNRKQAVTAEQSALLSSQLRQQQKQQQLHQQQLTRRVVRKHGFRGYVLSLVRRSMMLFLFGMAYGGIITHLHGHPTVAGRVPVRMEKIEIDRRSLGYLALWGIAGVVLGSLQPWFDLFWGDNLIVGRSPRGADRRIKGNGLLQWSPMVRSIGAFVGIAFAIVSIFTPLVFRTGESYLTSD